MKALITQILPDEHEVYFTNLGRPAFSHTCQWVSCETNAHHVLLMEHRLVPPLVLGLCQTHVRYPLEGNPVRVLTHDERLVLPVMVPHDPYAHLAWVDEGEDQRWDLDS